MTTALQWRLLVDWNNDGRFEVGVAEGTAPNLFKSAPYYGRAGIRLFNSSNVEQSYTENALNQGEFGHREFVLPFTSGGYAQIGLPKREGQREFFHSHTNLLDKTTLDYLERFNVAGTSAPHVPLFYKSGGTGFREVVSTLHPVPHGEYGTPEFHLIGGRWSSAIFFPAKFTAVLGQQYTFSFSARRTGVNPTFKAVVVPNNIADPVTSPTFFSPTSSWARYSFTFTAVANGATKVGVYLETSAGAVIPSFGLEISAPQVVAGAADAPFYMPDGDNNFPSIEQAAMVLEGGKDYVYSFWAKGDGTLTSLDLTPRFVEPGTHNFTDGTPVTIALTTSYQRYNIVIPSDTDTRLLVAMLTDPDAAGDATVTGFLLTEGLTGTVYHTGGETAAFEDITPYVLSVDWKSGKKKFDEYMPYEGTLSAVLDNEDKRFSPENEDTPLVTLAKQNLLTQLQVQHPVSLVWEPLWTGWTQSIEVVAGTQSNRQATLVCQQGLYRLREGDFTAGIYENMTAGDVAIDLINQSGFISGYSPFRTQVGISVLGENTYLNDTEAIFAQADPGVHPFELVGEGWGKKTQLEAALKELLLTEQMHLWIDRLGRLYLANRNHWVENQRTPVLAIEADTQAYRAEYEYGNSLLNRIEVSLKPKKEVKNTVLWETREALFVEANSERSQRMNIEFEEGKQKTVTKLYTQPNQITITGYYSSRDRFNDPTAVIPDTDLRRNTVLAITDDNTGRRTIVVRNNYDFGIYVDLEVKGDYIEGGGGVSYLFEDVNAIREVNAVHSEKIESNVYTTEDEARALAEYHFTRNGLPRGVFHKLNLKTTIADTDTLDRILLLQTGSIITVTEEQTSIDNTLHVVVGESGSIENNTIEVAYDIDFLDGRHWGLVGDNLEPLTNLYDGKILAVGAVELSEETFITDDGDTAQRLETHHADAYQIIVNPDKFYRHLDDLVAAFAATTPPTKLPSDIKYLGKLHHHIMPATTPWSRAGGTVSLFRLQPDVAYAWYYMNAADPNDFIYDATQTPAVTDSVSGTLYTGTTPTAERAWWIDMPYDATDVGKQAMLTNVFGSLLERLETHKNDGQLQDYSNTLAYTNVYLSIWMRRAPGAASLPNVELQGYVADVGGTEFPVAYGAPVIQTVDSTGVRFDITFPSTSVGIHAKLTIPTPNEPVYITGVALGYQYHSDYKASLVENENAIYLFV